MGGMSRSSLAFEEAAHQGPASLPFRVVHTYLIYVPFLHLHILRLKLFNRLGKRTHSLELPLRCLDGGKPLQLLGIWPIWDKFQLCVHSSVLCIWDQIGRAGKGCNVVAEQDPPCLAILAAIQISAYTRVTRMHALPRRERRPPRNLKIKPWHCYIEPFKHKVSLHLIWNGILLHLIQNAVSLYLGTNVSFHLIQTKIS